MLAQMDVEVVTITRAIGALGGEALYQVVFGKVGTATDKSPAPEGVKMTANFLMLFLPAEKDCPYTFGSRWKLTVEESGNVSLKKV